MQIREVWCQQIGQVLSNTSSTVAIFKIWWCERFNYFYKRLLSLRRDLASYSSVMSSHFYHLAVASWFLGQFGAAWSIFHHGYLRLAFIIAHANCFKSVSYNFGNSHKVGRGRLSPFLNKRRGFSPTSPPIAMPMSNLCYKFCWLLHSNITTKCLLYEKHI